MRLDEVEEAVYNFNVAELQNYAVGTCGVLVHNTNEPSSSFDPSSSIPWIDFLRRIEQELRRAINELTAAIFATPKDYARIARAQQEVDRLRALWESGLAIDRSLFQLPRPPLPVQPRPTGIQDPTGVTGIKGVN